MNSKVQYGQEHGPNLIKVVKKLISNQDLLKLLINTDLDPLNPEKHPNIINPYDEILNKYIKVVPLLLDEDLTTASKVVVMFDEGEVNSGNVDNENISMLISVYCPFKEWLIVGDAIRPFAIMSEIRKSLQDKRINGLGEITYSGFTLATLSEETGVYAMRFYINAFS